MFPPDVFEPKEMARQIAQERVTFTMGATPFLNDLTEHIERDHASTASLRVFVSVGAPIPRALVSRARQALGAAIISASGMSENGAVTTTRPEDPEEKTMATDGCALLGMEVRVVDVERNILATGVEGQLQVRGCSNFVGYLKRPELDNTDTDGWFDTGDFARMDAEGYIRIAGRSKDIIIRGGENIPVVEVEGLLFKHSKIAAVAIVGYPDTRTRRTCLRLCGAAQRSFVVICGDVCLFKGQQMAQQYIPERLELVTELPRTPSGKVQKFKLRETAKAFSEQLVG